MTTRTAAEPLHDRLFNALYNRSLVYNACWEDPAVDRQALELGPDDRVMVIASAGCNALDYLLDEPAAVHAVDLNPRQIALLDLKLAGIRALCFEDFFRIFGAGRHPDFATLYRRQLRSHLGAFSRAYWDRHGRVFVGSGDRRGLYFHGLSGKVARAFHWYLALRPALARAVRDLLAAPSLEVQREIYDQRVADSLWRGELRWLLSRQLTMSMLGVPVPQRHEVESQHRDGIAGFVREAIDYVFRELPLTNNYFWRVYLAGGYSADCCPSYLRPDSFERLQAGLVERLSIHTCSVTRFLDRTPEPISRFVLLDHMDWMSSTGIAALNAEWRAIFAAAAPGARVIFRSAHARPSYLDGVTLDAA